MSRFDSPLNNIKVASPCTVDWEGMFGNDRKRFCGGCSLNVYNLSGMTRDEAEVLLLQSEGRLCVRYYRRPDGTILTTDCPVGWAMVKQKISRVAAAAFSLLLTLFAGIGIMSFFPRTERQRWHFGVGEYTEMGAISVTNANSYDQGKPIMGNVAVPITRVKSR